MCYCDITIRTPFCNSQRCQREKKRRKEMGSGHDGLPSQQDKYKDHNLFVEDGNCMTGAPKKDGFKKTIDDQNLTFNCKTDIILKEVGDMLKAKNKSYGDAALNPVRIFSKQNSSEQLKVRIDDKLSRLARGTEYPGDDTIFDLVGYLVLFLINERQNNG
jgi:hypothetical protein